MWKWDEMKWFKSVFLSCFDTGSFQCLSAYIKPLLGLGGGGKHIMMNKFFLWVYEENACNSTIYTWTGGDKVRLEIYWWQWNYMFKHKLWAQTSTFACFYSLIKKSHFTFKTPSWKIVGGHPWVQKFNLNKIKTNTAPLHRDYEKVRFHSCSLWL